MWAEIIYWIGVLCCIWCVYDLFARKRSIETPLKVLLALVLLFFSWIGIVVYLLFIRDKMKCRTSSERHMYFITVQRIFRSIRKVRRRCFRR